MIHSFGVNQGLATLKQQTWESFIHLLSLMVWRESGNQKREGGAVALPTRLTLQLIIQTHLKYQSYNIDMLCGFFHLQLVSQRKKGHGHDSRVSKKNKKTTTEELSMIRS